MILTKADKLKKESSSTLNGNNSRKITGYTIYNAEQKKAYKKK
jgi:hypothetical protein